MPSIGLKEAQLEWEDGFFWPFYWVCGPEKLKSREFLKKLQKKISNDKNILKSFEFEVFEGDETHSFKIVEAFQSPTFFNQTKKIIIKEAHLLKNPESLLPLMRPKMKLDEIHGICICIAKDFDARKKFSKILIEKAAVIPCEAVKEHEKKIWIEFLAKKKKIHLSNATLTKLHSLEEWSLDLIEQELEKIALLELSTDQQTEQPSCDSTPLFSSHPLRSSEKLQVFLENFFSKKQALTMPCAHELAQNPSEAIPLLGLLSWNVKQLSRYIAYEKNKNIKKDTYQRHYEKNTYSRWSRFWTLPELCNLQDTLSDLDYNLKQVPLHPLGLWTNLFMWKD